MVCRLPVRSASDVNIADLENRISNAAALPDAIRKVEERSSNEACELWEEAYMLGEAINEVDSKLSALNFEIQTKVETVTKPVFEVEENTTVVVQPIFNVQEQVSIVEMPVFDVVEKTIVVDKVLEITKVNSINKLIVGLTIGLLGANLITTLIHMFI